MTRRATIGRWVTLFVLLAPTAWAGDVETGRARYVEGVAQFERGDHAAACRSFGEADALAPRDDALEAALRSCTLAGDAVRAMTFADRVDTRPFASPSLAEAQRDARAKLSSRVGRVRVACDACHGSIDGEAALPRSETWVAVGHHVVTFSGSPEQSIDVTAAATVEVAPLHAIAPSPPPSLQPRSERKEGAAEAPAARQGGLSPAWFWGGAALSATLGGVTVASFVDATSRHDGFVRLGCQSVPGADCAQMAGAGRDAETRSYVFLGVSAAAIVATAAVGLFAVRWRDASVTVGPTHAGLFVRY